MARSRRCRLRLASTGALVALTGTLGACDGTAGDAEAEPSSTAPATSPSSSPTATPGPGAKCVRAEVWSARSIWIWNTVHQVTNFPSDTRIAQGDLVRRVGRTARRLGKACPDGLPPAFTRFREAVDPLAAQRIGDAQLDRLLAAWLRWGRAVGGPETAQRTIGFLRDCRQRFLPDFDATYRVTSTPTETGTMWLLDLTFDNRTGAILDGSMGGTTKVTGMLPDPFGQERGPKPGPGRDAVLYWGGSSSDILELSPGTTSVTAALDIDEDVHTTADGSLRVVGIELYLAPRHGSVSCNPPVRPAA